MTRYSYFLCGPPKPQNKIRLSRFHYTVHGFAVKWCLPNWFLDQLKVELLVNRKFKTIINAYNTINKIFIPKA